MVAKNPANPLARFGLANELLKAGRHADAERELALYLASYDDEGNGWLRYADILHTLGRTDDARAAAQRGMEASARYGHGSMVQEFEARIESWS